jgi:hypothetical protein
MPKLIFVLLSLIFTNFALGQRQKLDPISIGNISLAEERMKIKLDLFEIKYSTDFPVTARLVKDSLQWVRLDHVLLLPRALVEVTIQEDADHQFFIDYSGQKIIPLFNPATQTYQARFFVSLFESFPIKIFEKSDLVNVVRVLPRVEKLASPHLIDYSCARYNISIEGLKDDFISLGCQVQRTGRFGDERPYLEVYLTSASHRLRDQSDPPYVILFHESGEARVNLVSPEGTEESITIKANLPPRLHRLRLAAGFGPYTLQAAEENQDNKMQIAPTVMLYGNFTLNDTTSLRFFDSYSRASSTFHNWGVYYAWELAEFCDRRCTITSLVGLQGVEYRYNSKTRTHAETILPQGFEFVYKHPFGKQNYIFNAGGFVGLSAQYNYNNIWVRYGKRYFWELNFIEWKRGNQSASMFGLSVGFPIGGFF